MSPLSQMLTAFELSELVPDGWAGAVDADLDSEDQDRVESRSELEVALPGSW